MFRLKLSFIAVLLVGRKGSLAEKVRVQNHDGLGCEHIQSRLDLLEIRLSEYFDQLKKQVEGSGISLGNKVSQITNQMLMLQNKLLDPICLDLPKAWPGNCLMNIGGNKTVVYQVYRFDADWLTVLQRYDGSVNFNRNWTEYRNGFGTAGQEFWLGLERLHVLTKKDSYELLVELEDFAGNYKYARYDKFSIGSEQDLYRLNMLGAYSGTAGDSFRDHKGHQFSTSGKGPKVNCAHRNTGGWWYERCYKCRLTGKWDRTATWTSIIWMSFGSEPNTPLSFARMLIRKL